MPTLTLKNIPDDLYTRLKNAAKIHHRSMNSEILYCVERTLTPHKIDVSETCHCQNASSQNRRPPYYRRRNQYGNK